MATMLKREKRKNTEVIVCKKLFIDQSSLRAMLNPSFASSSAIALPFAIYEFYLLWALVQRNVRSISSLQHQVLTIELERDSERRLAQLRRSRSVSHEYLHGNDADGAADLNTVLPQ